MYQDLSQRRVWVSACSQNIDECKIQNSKVEQTVCTIKTNIVKILSVQEKIERAHYTEAFGEIKSKTSSQLTIAL